MCTLQDGCKTWECAPKSPSGWDRIDEFTTTKVIYVPTMGHVGYQHAHILAE